MNSGLQKLDKPKDTLKVLSATSKENSRCPSICTKSSSNINSPFPDKDINPLSTSIVREISDSEASAVDDPAVLIMSSITPKSGSLDQISGIKKENLALKLKKAKRKNRSATIKESIKELKTQIIELSVRASVCESELKAKEKENSELKTMVSSLKEFASSEAVVVDKNESTCKSCCLF